MEKIPPELIGRVIQDSEFRHRLINDPETVLADSGYELDQEQIDALKELDSDAVDKAIEAMVGELDPTMYG